MAIFFEGEQKQLFLFSFVCLMNSYDLNYRSDAYGYDFVVLVIQMGMTL